MKKTATGFFKAIVMLGFALSSPSASYADDGLDIKHLGVNNTIVRITGDNHYLMLPVQESADDAKINVIVNGNIAKTIYVKLAKSKTDYSVPFDLTPYKAS